MTSFDDITLPDADLNPAGLDTSTNQGKLTDLWNKGRDVWWRVCSRSGLAKLIAAFADGLLDRGLLKSGPDWRPTTVPTSPRQEIAALPQNFKNVQDGAAAAKASADAAAAAVAQLRSDLPGLVEQAVQSALANVNPATGSSVSVDPKAFAAEVITELEQHSWRLT